MEQDHVEILDLPSLCSSESGALGPNGPGSRFNTHWGHILLLDFLFSHSKGCDANIAIVAIFGYFVKTAIKQSISNK